MSVGEFVPYPNLTLDATLALPLSDAHRDAPRATATLFASHSTASFLPRFRTIRSLAPRHPHRPSASGTHLPARSQRYIRQNHQASCAYIDHLLPPHSRGHTSHSLTHSLTSECRVHMTNKNIDCARAETSENICLHACNTLCEVCSGAHNHTINIRMDCIIGGRKSGFPFIETVCGDFLDLLSLC